MRMSTNTERLGGYAADGMPRERLCPARARGESSGSCRASGGDSRVAHRGACALAAGGCGCRARTARRPAAPGQGGSVNPPPRDRSSSRAGRRRGDGRGRRRSARRTRRAGRPLTPRLRREHATANGSGQPVSPPPTRLEPRPRSESVRARAAVARVRGGLQGCPRGVSDPGGPRRSSNAARAPAASATRPLSLDLWHFIPPVSASTACSTRWVLAAVRARGGRCRGGRTWWDSLLRCRRSTITRARTRSPPAAASARPLPIPGAGLHQPA